jgi:large subunit ribosomal protein LP0
MQFQDFSTFVSFEELRINVFFFLSQVYDSGTIFDPAILDITDNDLKNRFMSGVRNVAAVSLQIGYPNVASAPHSMANGVKKCLALAAVTDITFKAAEMLKAYLADPSKFAVAAAPAAAAAPGKKVEAKKEEEPEEEEDDDMGFGLFD